MTQREERDCPFCGDTTSSLPRHLRHDCESDRVHNDPDDPNGAEELPDAALVSANLDWSDLEVYHTDRDCRHLPDEVRPATAEDARKCNLRRCSACPAARDEQAPAVDVDDDQEVLV